MHICPWCVLFRDLLAKNGLLDSKTGKPATLLPEQARLINLFTVFAFKKI